LAKFKKFNKRKEPEIREIYVENGEYVYDGVLFLKSMELDEIKTGLRIIKDFIKKNKKKCPEITYRLKYSIVNDVKPSKNKDGSFSLTLDITDPRTTLIVSDLNLLPKSEWKIKKDWI
jgi:hypothetical protein